MSFLFGGRNNNEDREDDDDRDDNDDNNRDDVKGKVVADFDPTALERGAQALREIDKSTNAKDALRLAMIQEKTKQAELQKREQELIQQNLMHRERISRMEHENKLRENELNQEQWKERLGTEMKQKQQMEQQLLSEKKRAQEEFLQKQRQLNEENIRRQQQSNEEMEQRKLKTLEYKAKLDQELARVKAKAKSEGRIEQEKKNEDIHLRSQKERLEEERKTQVDLAKEKFAAWRDIFKNGLETVTDQHKMKVLGIGIVGITFGVYVARKGVNIAGNYIESRLGKPNLIRETSRWSPIDYVRFKKWYWYFRTKGRQGKDKTVDELKGIILAPHVKNKMQFIARTTRNTKARKGPYRHLCIYGPPGTGKTLFARTLSRDSGLDYAIISGGDFAPLGANAVTELHKVFDWAEASRKGTILFIDEADAFLRKGREGDKMSEHMRNALSAFLYRTGTETTHFMIVIATNVPEALDKAILDRTDDLVEFPLPGPAERKEMLQHYFHEFLVNANMGQKFLGGPPIIIKGFEEDPDIWDRLTEMTDQFSGRQIAKFMIHVQATMYGSPNNTELTPYLMQQLLETFLKSRAFGLEK